MSNPVLISKRLFDIRNNYDNGRKKTQEEFAELLNVSVYTYRNWEQGRIIPDLSTLYELSEKLNVSVSYLLGDDAHPTKGVKAICEITGLSIETATKFVNSCSDADNMKLLDSILANDKLYDFVLNALKYPKYKSMSEADDFSEKFIGFVNTVDSLPCDKQDFLLNRISEVIRDVESNNDFFSNPSTKATQKASELKKLINYEQGSFIENLLSIISPVMKNIMIDAIGTLDNDSICYRVEKEKSIIDYIHSL